MNTFAVIKEIIVFSRVRYYSVKFTEDQLTEFEKFITYHSRNVEVAEEYNDLMAWIKVRIGNKDGALEKYFRHEGAANALPPNSQFLETEYDNNIRLYCYRISNHVVILFNGGIKSKNCRTAQECPVVKQHFDLANKLVKTIDLAFQSQDVRLSDDQKELIIEPDFELEL